MEAKLTTYLFQRKGIFHQALRVASVACRALALNCHVPVNDKKGAEAKNWKEGKPVRVVRSCKGRKHSKYCPEEGNRYDGIYKVWPKR